MKNLKMILPLYLGQEVLIEKGEVLEISCVLGYEFKYMVQAKGGKTPIPLNIYPENFGKGCFLLLRPLSSMTEEEAREACEIVGVDFYGMVDISEGKGIHFLNEGELVIASLHDTGEINLNSVFSFCPMSLIPALASKGFDCFGLIPAGIAKDVSKLNTPS